MASRGPRAGSVPLDVAERTLGVKGVYAEIHVPEGAEASAEAELDDGPTWH